MPNRFRSVVPLHAAAILVALSASAALAQPRHRVYGPGPDGPFAPAPPPGYAFAPWGEPVPAGPRCIPWCPRDANPCDAPQLKIADGRCSQDRD